MSDSQRPKNGSKEKDLTGQAEGDKARIRRPPAHLPPDQVIPDDPPPSTTKMLKAWSQYPLEEKELLVNRAMPDPNSFNIYMAEVNPKEYPPNHGALISKEFITPTEDDNMSVKDSISQALDETVFNQKWFEELVSKEVKDTLLDAGWVTDKLTSAFVSLMEGQMPHTPGGTVSQGYAQAKQAYNRVVVVPRVDRTYAIAKDISPDSFGLSNVNQKLTRLKIPTQSAQAWIVTDVPNAKAEGLKQGTNAFVCFSEQDANDLKMQIKNNYDINTVIVKSVNPIHADNFSADLSNDIVRETKDVMTASANSLNKYCQRQIEFQNDINKIRSEMSLNQNVGRDLAWFSHISSNDYPDFQKLFAISTKVNQLVGLMNTYHQPYKSADAEKILKRLNELGGILNDYIISHPYKGPDNDVVHKVCQNLGNLMNQFRVEIENDKKHVDMFEKEVDRFSITTKNNHGIYMQDAIHAYYEVKKAEMMSSQSYINAAIDEKHMVQFALLKAVSEFNKNGFSLADIKKLDIYEHKSDLDISVNKFVKVIDDKNLNQLKDMDNFVSNTILGPSKRLNLGATVPKESEKKDNFTDKPKFR